MIHLLWDFSLPVLFFIPLLGLVTIIQFTATTKIRGPKAAKMSHLLAEGIFALLFIQFARSALRNVFIALVYGVILLTGNTFRAHLQSRPTAAYSTSDLYHQRMFNMTFMAQIAGFIVGILLYFFGVSLFDGILKGIPAPNHVVVVILALFVGTRMIRNAVALFSHRKTFFYLTGNYLKGWSQGKLRRIF